MESKFLKDIPKKGPFEVPEGYFEQLHAQIVDHTCQAGQIAPERAVTAIPGEYGSVFQVPPGYFDSLPARINSRLAADRPAKPLNTRTTAGYFEVAVAACIALMLGILSVLQVEKLNEPDDSIVSATYFGEELLVQEYLETAISLADEQTGELEQYLLNQVEESFLLQELKP